MKKLSFLLSLVAFSLCFTLQGGHAMDDTAPSGDEFHKGGMKGLREPNPAMPLKNDQPFSTPHFTLEVFKYVLLPNTSYTSDGKIIWAHRLVCKAWKSMLGLIKTVDLSHEYIVPLAKRVELMNADKPVEIFSNYLIIAYFFRGHLKISIDDEKYRFFKHNEPYQVDIGDFVTPGAIVREVDLWRETAFNWWEAKYSGETLYKYSENNPLKKFFERLTVDPGIFTDVETLILRHNFYRSSVSPFDTLENNTYFDDDSLGKLTHLTSLDLTANNQITDTSLSKLTNLKSLKLKRNRLITKESVSVLTNLTCLDADCKIPLNSLMGLTNLTDLGVRGLTDRINDRVDEEEDYINLLARPHLKKLSFRDFTACIYQYKMILAEALIEDLKKDREKCDSEEIQKIENKYFYKVLIPNAYGLGNGLHKTTFDVDINSLVYKKEDIDYLLAISVAQALFEEHGTDYELERKYLELYQESKDDNGIEKITKDLLALRGKEIEIYWKSRWNNFW